MPIVNGTTYSTDTDPEVIRILEAARVSGDRVRLHYGHTRDTDCDGKPADLGLDWLDTCDVRGSIGRSMGPVRVPILLHSRRSMGGASVLDSSIVLIRASPGGCVLYRHPAYHTGTITLGPCVVAPSEGTPAAVAEAYRFEVCRNGEVQARFKSVEQARRYLGELGIAPPPVTYPVTRADGRIVRVTVPGSGE